MKINTVSKEFIGKQEVIKIHYTKFLGISYWMNVIPKEVAIGLDFDFIDFDTGNKIEGKNKELLTNFYKSEAKSYTVPN